MAKTWTEYQQEVAAFFSTLGCEAKVEEVVKGARGKHKVDVVVEFEQFRLHNLWAIECKLWKSNVPKKEVLTFQSIVHDIGADKGFVLSEKGFQAGAIACAQNTNITLTSLAELRGRAKDELRVATVNKKLTELQSLSNKLSKLGQFEYRREKDKNGKLIISGYGQGPADQVMMFGKTSLLREALKQARDGRFPVVYDFSPDERPIVANDMPSLLQAFERFASELHRYCEKNKDFASSGSGSAAESLRTGRRARSEPRSAG